MDFKDKKGYNCYNYKRYETYRCSKCKMYKEKEAFYKSRTRSTGVKGYCKVCDIEDAKLRYKRKKDSL